MAETNGSQQSEKPVVGSTAKDSRVALINTIQTPLGFFVLVILIVEVIFGIIATFSSGTDKTYIIIGMLFLIFLLVFIVAGMAVFRPMSLYGVPTKSKRERKPAEFSPKVEATEIETICKPRILWASSLPSFSTEPIHQDIKTIRQAFPKSKLITEQELTADRFRDLLTKNKFDIVQLTVNVRGDGSIDFWHSSENDSISGEGVVQLLEVSNTRLIILASCNSVPLAAKLAPKMTMIAATGTLEVNTFNKWQRVFYQLLSEGESLYRAYDIARNSVSIPIAIIMKDSQDLVFAK